ncbi:hypothetical protein D3C85_801340 [compost metagenome]
MKLVSNWKKLHKSYTVILSIVGVLVSLSEAILPSMGLIQPILDPVTYGAIMFCLSVCVAVGRYLQQASVEQDD